MTTTCGECGATKPDGLNEKRAAPTLRKWANEMHSLGLLNTGHVRFLMAYAMEDFAAACAPLEAKVRELEKERGGWKESANRWQSAFEVSDLRAKEMEARIESMQGNLENTVCDDADKAKRIAELEAQVHDLDKSNDRLIRKVGTENARVRELESQVRETDRDNKALHEENRKARERIAELEKSASWWEEEHGRERAARHAWVAWATRLGALATGPDAEKSNRTWLEAQLAQAKGLPAVGEEFEYRMHSGESWKPTTRYEPELGRSDYLYGRLPTGTCAIPVSCRDCWRRIPAQTSRESAASTPGKPEYWQALRWAAGRVSSRGDSQVSSESAAPFYALAREIEGAIQKEWGMNGPGSEPASSPPTSAPDGVTMENFYKWMGTRWINGKDCTGADILAAREASEADIRANLARERAKWEGKCAEVLARADRAAVDNLVCAEKRSAERIAELEEALERVRQERERVRRDLVGQRDDLRAKLEASEHANATQQHAIRELEGRLASRDMEIAEMSAATEKLSAELAAAKAPKRCPADGMSPREIGHTIKQAIWPESGGFDGYEAGGDKARELFTPVADKPTEKRVPKKGDAVAVLVRYEGKVDDVDGEDFTVSDSFGTRLLGKVAEQGNRWWLVDNPSAKGAE